MRRSLVVALVGALVTVGAAEAQAAATWTVFPSPPIPEGSSLGAMSCVAAHSCVVVGSASLPGGGSAGVAARLHGERWRPIAVPSVVSGISCTSPTSCEAIIAVAPSRWNGRRWTSQPFPTPNTGGGGFNAIACTSQTNCVAVGSFASNTVNGLSPLVERWNGRLWRIQPVFQPRLGGQLFAVSCSAANACTAVGEADGNGNNGVGLSHSIAYRFNGRTWQVSHPPDPVDAIFGQLTTVACPSASTCVAPSTYDNGGDENQAFADVWNDGRWRITPLPIPASSIANGESFIDSVSCVSAAACVAVGTWDSLSGQGPLVETWNGATWRNSRGPLPLPPNGVPGTGTLGTISCGSPTTCIAAGSYTTTTGATQVLIEQRLTLG